MPDLSVLPSLAVAAAPLLAQTSAAREVREWDFFSPVLWEATDWLLAAGFVAAIVLVVALYLRESRSLSLRGGGWWCAGLAALRVAVVLLLLLVFLNPHQRTETQAYRASQVLLLVDTSASMEQPERDPRTSGGAPPRSRSEAVKSLLRDSPLIEALRQYHQVDLYTFDGELSDTRHRFLTRFTPGDVEATNRPESTGASAETAPPDWDRLLAPVGVSTRLGDSLDKLLAQAKGKSLSGVVVFSDGANNVGRDWQAANQRAREGGVRLFGVGVGSTTPPVNVQVARLIAPTDVQLGDPFELTGILQSAGLFAGGRPVVPSATFRVELLEQAPGEPQPRVVATQETSFAADGEPVSVRFERLPAAAGEIEYSLRLVAPGLVESRDDDNIKGRRVNIFDRPLRILVIAGGPGWDYRFAKNLLYRHKSMQVDAWLQTGEPGISQDAENLLFAFPTEREELFAYDVVLAFDPDWSKIPPEGRAMLEEWVTEYGGGVVIVAGDVHTPQLAAIDPEREPGFESILNLYPVLLEEVGINTGRRAVARTAYPLGLTQAGEAADFLQLTDDPGTSLAVWEEFPGLYRCYPTRGRKGGTTVYAEHTDPLARGRDGAPVLLAGQRYGLGSNLYLGSPEMYRLRALDEEYYDRFWVKLVRKAAEGRLKRGLERAVLLLEGRDYEVGQTVPIRARLVDANYKPLTNAAIELQVTKPDGKPLIPGPVLQQDSNRLEEYFGTLRVEIPGRYRLDLSTRALADKAFAEINVVMPRREAEEPLQDRELLTKLSDGTGGRYVSIEEAATVIPPLLPNMGHEFLLDQRIQELWDQQWLLVLIGVLLAAEWLARKMLRLA